ncbi:MAG: sigma 54-interacting transcriptional regulator [Desulfovibrio sp.]|nr:sigma 54-interacting transcriptional regulator [Desulfovibrio sp.]
MKTHDASGVDAVLAASHLFPLQKNIPELLRLLKFCCTPLLPFERVLLMIETPLQEHARIYSLDTTATSCDCTPIDRLLEGKYALFRQQEPAIFTKERFLEAFQVAKRVIPQDARHILLLPLPVEVPGYYAVLMVIRTSEQAFDTQALPFCRLLRGFVTAQVSQFLQQEEAQLERDALRKERDQLNILVAVTNVAMSSLHTQAMLDMLALDIRRFFALHDVGLELFDGEQVLVLCAKSGQASLGTGERRIARTASLCQALAPLESPHILQHAQLVDMAAHDPLVANFLAANNRVVCAIPLIFQENVLGVLALAHTAIESFTRDAVSLLLQIGHAVALAVRNATEYASVRLKAERLFEENAYLSSEIAQQWGGGTIIGQSPAIEHVLYQVSMVAKSDSTVLLLGETGTGKEMVAEAIHMASQRKEQRMVKINCAAVPETLLESELFGYEKGAFTGANRQHKGRFEIANGSTLLLDEVGDMPLALQPKLLRILQSRELERLGGQSVIPIDVRLVAATNQDLLAMVQQKRFRDDLYYRLNVFPIRLPPLRERREDIPLLALHFMQEHAKRMKKTITSIPQSGIDWLCSQPWPGNVRELANVIERAVILTQGTSLCLDGSVFQGQRVQTVQEPDAPRLPKKESDEAMIKAITHAVRVCNGVIAGSRGAAAMLGVNRTTLNSRMKRLGLTVQNILQSRMGDTP